MVNGNGQDFSEAVGSAAAVRTLGCATPIHNRRAGRMSLSEITISMPNILSIMCHIILQCPIY